MRSRKSGCRKPDQLKDRPEKCSASQIVKCHGEAKRHPCVTLRKAK